MEGGLGIGSKVKLPYIGGVELLLKGPTISDTFSINFAKGCDDDEGCVEITAVDLKGNIGASFDIGVGFGSFISYYSSYEFKIVVRMCKSGYMKTFSKGWISGGAFGAHLGPIDLGGEFRFYPFDFYNRVFCNGFTSISGIEAHGSDIEPAFILCPVNFRI